MPRSYTGGLPTELVAAGTAFSPWATAQILLGIGTALVPDRLSASAMPVTAVSDGSTGHRSPQ